MLTRFTRGLTILLFLYFPARGQAQWAPQVLGPLEGRPTFAAAINDRGDVVGHSWNDQGEQIPVLWTAKAGYRTFLGDLAGSATDINNRGDVVGTRLSVSSGSSGFLWSDERGLVDLGVGFLPLSINHAGVIAGACNGTPETTGPCIWVNGSTVMLTSDCGGAAQSINDAGDVVGYTVSCTGTGSEEPFVWDQHTGFQLLSLPVGAWGGLAEDITNSGLIVGWSGMVLDGRAFHRVLIWDRHGRLQDAPDEINGIAVAANNGGVAVGVSPALRFEESRGFGWRRRDGIASLAGGDASLPADINSRGEIAGSIYADGVWFAAIWYRQPSKR